ncbi:hypothetical protein [Caballeronia sp. Lep1P3]|uniref:hypothetical protein n=1 Tax=Caballeronia sp. Lep1P3 TaxID=2878150 RepID=UPI001FD30E6E|nr:hypothetical protein [Caballeronia sp. Lep1P3]
MRRQIRQLIENALAKEMLKGDVAEGARVLCRYDADTRRIVFDAGRTAAAELGTPPTP